MDQLKRAWDLLEPGERPEGMDLQSLGGVPLWSSGSTLLDERSAHDRLCLAVEGVLLDAGWAQAKRGDEYEWWGEDPSNPTSDRDTSHPDRLTAACNALEAERGGA